MLELQSQMLKNKKVISVDMGSIPPPVYDPPVSIYMASPNW